MKATVITDASFCSKTRAAGWAAWITLDNGKRIKMYGAFHGKPQKSTEAEWWAALNGMYIAYKAGAEEILLQSDCLWVVDRIKHNPKYHLGFFRRRDINNISITSRHVKGHTTTDNSRSYVNRWCDENAKRSMKAVRDKK